MTDANRPPGERIGGWTRLVTASKTTYNEKPIDLPEFITQNREKLALKPNDDYSDLHSYFGWEMDDAGWDRALKMDAFALRRAGTR